MSENEADTWEARLREAAKRYAKAKRTKSDSWGGNLALEREEGDAIAALAAGIATLCAGPSIPRLQPPKAVVASVSRAEPNVSRLLRSSLSLLSFQPHGGNLYAYENSRLLPHPPDGADGRRSARDGAAAGRILQRAASRGSLAR